MRLYAIILKVLDNPGKWDFYDRQVGEAQRQAFAEMVANALSMAEQIAPESETSSTIPAEFAQLAAFYQVTDMAALVRVQEERIEDMRQQLPKPRGPESDPQNYRRG